MTTKDNLPLQSTLNTIGMIARWKPVHLGQLPVLRALTGRAERALIGIGSSNRYNLRNPFTLEETTDMIRLALGERDNYSIIPVPDLDDGPRWREMVLEMFGPLDLFVTANPYVASLLAEDYEITHPVKLIAESEKIPLDGTMVRTAMAQGDGWKEMVPAIIADYIQNNKLDQRFRKEFGLEAQAIETIVERNK